MRARKSRKRGVVKFTLGQNWKRSEGTLFTIPRTLLVNETSFVVYNRLDLRIPITMGRITSEALLSQPMASRGQGQVTVSEKTYKSSTTALKLHSRLDSFDLTYREQITLSHLT